MLSKCWDANVRALKSGFITIFYCVRAQKSKPQDSLLYAKFLAEVKAGLNAAAHKDELDYVSLGASLGQSSRWRVTADASASAQKFPQNFILIRP